MVTIFLAMALAADTGARAAASSAGLASPSSPMFTAVESRAIAGYWSAPGRYAIGPAPSAARSGVWQVRPTPEGSAWFWKYQAAIGAAAAPPTHDTTATTPDTASWEAWITAKLAYDAFQAQATADRLNSAPPGGDLSTPAAGAASGGPTAGSRSPSPDASDPDSDTVPPLIGSAATPSPAPPLSPTPGPTPPAPGGPPAPGPIPPGLEAAVGDPPPFLAAAAPRGYTVVFDDGDTYRYEDHVVHRPRFAYYRFAQGVMASGLRTMPSAELDPLFLLAGMTPSETRIAEAVSRLEGGFDSVNTYDTGHVSIGFLQFITGRDGRGSLLAVLANEKKEAPDSFFQDFHRFGIDVDPGGELEVLDPETGAPLSGAAAVQKVIDDKRLTAVFQRAGRRSQAFRAAQIRVARAWYWPASDPVTVTVNGMTVAGKVSDFIHSEAGLATLFDRKVNRGTLRPLPDVMARVLEEHHLTTLADLSLYEREIVSAMKYRTDFMADTNLTQPPALPVVAAPPSPLPGVSPQ